MATLTRQLQDIVMAYRNAGEQWPATTHEIAQWAVNNHRWYPQSSAIIDQCANQLAQAMRDEHVVDPQGRAVRAKHVARVSRNGECIFR